MMRENYPEGAWAPVVIETLLHVYTRPTPVRECTSSDWALATLVKAEMITSDSESASSFSTTPRGVAHIQALCQHPYPKEKSVWINPLTGEAIKVPFK